MIEVYEVVDHGLQELLKDEYEIVGTIMGMLDP